MTAIESRTGESDASITRLLHAARDGSTEALDRLMPLVYAELRAIAHRHMRAERHEHTLSTTALVHEAYLRLVGHGSVDWRDRAHFYGIASRVMRQVLVDYARRRRTKKRSALPPLPLDHALAVADNQAELILALDEALGRLALIDERQSLVVQHRFFGGLTEDEIGAMLGVSARTVRNDWVKARGWLYREIFGDMRDPAATEAPLSAERRP